MVGVYQFPLIVLPSISADAPVGTLIAVLTAMPFRASSARRPVTVFPTIFALTLPRTSIPFLL